MYKQSKTLEHTFNSRKLYAVKLHLGGDMKLVAHMVKFYFLKMSG
jgi:hypothetical protein